MARISQISLKQEPEHYTLTVRKTIDFMMEYSDFADEVLETTSAYIKGLGVLPIGGPVTCFHNMELEELDVEMGWQIVKPIEDKGEMKCRHVLTGKVVSAIDLGPYEEQDPTLLEIFDWINEQKLEPQGPITYCYLNDTQRPPAELLTLMKLRVKG